MVLGRPTENSNVKMHGQFDDEEEMMVLFDRNHWLPEFDYLMHNGGIVRVDGEDLVSPNPCNHEMDNISVSSAEGNNNDINDG